EEAARGSAAVTALEPGEQQAYVQRVSRLPSRQREGLDGGTREIEGGNERIIVFHLGDLAVRAEFLLDLVLPAEAEGGLLVFRPRVCGQIDTAVEGQVGSQ